MDFLLKTLREAVEEKKAEDPVILDLVGISDVADYFLICSGNTPIQVRAIADHLTATVVEAGLPAPRKEGYAEGRWILLDFGQVIVHLLHQQEREFYRLENLWHDAKIVKMTDIVSAASEK